MKKISLADNIVASSVYTRFSELFSVNSGRFYHGKPTFADSFIGLFPNWTRNIHKLHYGQWLEWPAEYILRQAEVSSIHLSAPPPNGHSGKEDFG